MLNYATLRTMTLRISRSKKIRCETKVKQRRRSPEIRFTGCVVSFIQLERTTASDLFPERLAVVVTITNLHWDGQPLFDVWFGLRRAEDLHFRQRNLLIALLRQPLVESDIHAMRHPLHVQARARAPVGDERNSDASRVETASFVDDLAEDTFSRAGAELIGTTETSKQKLAATLAVG